MAMFNFNCFTNFNFAQPNFSFGCFTMPNFFSNFSLFGLGCDGFNQFGQFPYTSMYSNYGMMNSSSIFSNFSTPMNYGNYSFPSTPNFFDSTNSIFGTPSWDSSFVYTLSGATSRTTSQNKKPLSGSLKEYSSERGEKLAQIALQNKTGFNKQCATYVKNAIQEAGLGSYVQGDAHRTDEILANNANFKEISVEGVNINELPAGCVLVYEKGAAGYSSEYGHVEITTGDGRGVSDGITNNLRTPSSIFIPVSA